MSDESQKTKLIGWVAPTIISVLLSVNAALVWRSYTKIDDQLVDLQKNVTRIDTKMGGYDGAAAMAINLMVSSTKHEAQIQGFETRLSALELSCRQHLHHEAPSE